MHFFGQCMAHGSAIMRANKIQVNQRIYVKGFIGNPEKWQEAIFQDGLSIC